MSEGRGSAPCRSTAWIAAVCAVVAAGAAIRVALCAGRELWYDDVGRLQQALVPWPALWDSVPKLGNLKSPYLIVLHKAWIDVAGTASIEALRGSGVVWGVAVAGLAAAVVWRTAGPLASLATAALYATNPFFIRWSIEIHHYYPAAAAVLAAWFVALRRGGLDTRGFLVLGGFAGLAVGIFPPAGAALIPLLLVPGLRRPGALRGWIYATALAGAVALPAVLSITESQRIFGPAFAEGRGWAPYFNPVKSPFEVTARLAGLDVRQGAFTRTYAVGVGVLLVSTVFLLTTSPERRDAPEIWQRRVAVVCAGLLPMLALAIVSLLWIGVFTDRYVIGAAAAAPAAAIVALWPARNERPGANLRTVARFSAAVVVALPLVAGFRTMLEQGDGFPRDLTNRSYRCAALLDRALAAHPTVRAVYVHGEGQFSHVVLRSAAAREAHAEVFHLSTAEWVSRSRARDMSHVAVPPAYGWPFNAEVVAGHPATVDVAAARARIARGEAVMLVVERPPNVRITTLEDDETSSGVGDCWSLAELPPSPARDAKIAAAGRRALGAPESWDVAVMTDGRAAVIVATPR